MEIVGDNSCYTSKNPKGKIVYCRGEPRQYWLELQFVDENYKPVTGLTVTLEYQPLHEHVNPTPPPHPPAGVTDDQGVVRFEDLKWVAVRVKAEAQQLADEMEQRPLSIRRNPNSQPVNKNAFHRTTRDTGWRSEVQEQAESAGNIHHYVVLGELCDRMPVIEGWEGTEPPEFHFPQGQSFDGMAIERDALEKRHVIEICPFRAWILALYDTKEYDLANALNLGIMADLAYSAEKESHAIDYFFNQKCLDLSAIPQFAEFPSYFHTLSVDVPFKDRYRTPLYLNTKESEIPEGDTRLFIAECQAHILVAWCGTDSLLNGLTDVSFAPKKCLPKLAGAGNIHGGFFEAYKLAKEKFQGKGHFSNIVTSVEKGKILYVCGHSLGGALALTYAAEMKEFNPILYTYGMPRTFTMSSMSYLENITHYRHVNDNDTVTQVPPDADLDNYLYKFWGPLGDKLGFDWGWATLMGLNAAELSLAAQSLGLMEKKDPYWHHGNTVIFFQAQQCVMTAKRQFTPWIGGGGSDNPAPGVVYYCSKIASKLFLVPILNDECLKATGEHQAKFIQCLDPLSLREIFPKNTNPSLDGLLSNPLSHSMAHRYLPYLHNQILELANPELPMKRKEMREKFRQEIEKGALVNGQPDEIKRNREFLALQNMLPVAMRNIKSEDISNNALLRYAAVTEESVELN